MVLTLQKGYIMKLVNAAVCCVATYVGEAEDSYQYILDCKAYCEAHVKPEDLNHLSSILAQLQADDFLRFCNADELELLPLHVQQIPGMQRAINVLQAIVDHF